MSGVKICVRREDNNRRIVTRCKRREVHTRPGIYLIVAGGGGGIDAQNWHGGDGGGDKGGDGQNTTNTVATGGCTSTATPGSSPAQSDCTSSAGSFGKGGFSRRNSGTGSIGSSTWDVGAGGGGGYYGGGGTHIGGGTAGGGSGYVGGVDAPKATIAGSNNFESPSGSQEKGHSSSGYARISITRS